MDPINRGPEDFGHDDDRGGDNDGRPRSTRDDGPPPAHGQGGAPPGKARTAQLVSGDLLLTINPIDGSEIEPCPPGRLPEPPGRHTPEERAGLTRAAGPPVPPGPAAPPLPLLERQEERERLVRLLSRGRSVRLTGPAGSGRTSLLAAVASDCAGLAPDGVVRLSGHHRTPTELLYELFATVHRAPAHRPDRAGLLAAVHEIGAVVVLDDLEFGGTALDELLAATPECAYLLAATPDVAAPSADSHLEEVFLSGLDRSSSLELLERGVDRPLTDDEANWAGDLWFESEGLPLRFVQAGALLRQRDELRAGPSDDEDDDNVFADGREAPLPSLGDGAAPVPLLASRLSESARETLRFAVALGGEVPHQAHLPALVNDTHADAALGELLRCGLLTPVGTRYRLAPGVMAQLVAKGYDEGAADRAHTAAHHYAWWVGHPSVSPERAAAEADAVLAALTALVQAAADSGSGGSDVSAVGSAFGGPGGSDTPGGSAGLVSASSADEEEGYADTAVALARSAAPAFAAGLHWGAWERALRTGAEAARHAGEVAEEAYFHHELGVLALCAGNLDRARAELEASIAMRGALADKRGTVAGRRALALVADRERGPLLGGRTAAGEEVPAARYEESASPPGGVPAATPKPKPAALPGLSGDTETLITHPDPPAPAAKAGPTPRRTILNGARRNLVAAGAGAILAAVLGTVVTLGATSGGDDGKGGSGRVTSDQSANEEGGDGGLDADEPDQGSTRHPGDDGGDSGGTGGSGSPGTPGSSARPGETGSAGTPSTPSGDPSTTTGGTTPTTSGPSSGSPTSSGPTTGAPTTGGTTTGGSTGGSTSGGTTGDTTSGGSTSGDTTSGSTSGDTTTGSTTGDTTSGSTTGDTTSGSTTGDTTSGSTTGDTTSGAGGGTTSGGTEGSETSGATQSAPAPSSDPTPTGTAA
ncbi:AAA family ATPase [Streptomyces sp. CB03234]|uniref:AAA family ATPase n=1 Tax=Streptomyces sp. (strain CB03234) TaxID=1703937 RepID=UPI0009397B9D|nr:AAA family ATPase [Streptomyces sp. CB03234]OKK06559.1 AAA family ATPase [Streptomyces sp. CB03234]